MPRPSTSRPLEIACSVAACRASAEVSRSGPIRIIVTSRACSVTAAAAASAVIGSQQS